ncbi:MAG: hypothetical protein U0176_12375 [Bacteroidia bacterium]
MKQQQQPTEEKRSILFLGGYLFVIISGVIALASIIGTIFQFDLDVKGVRLPNRWPDTIALIVVLSIVCGIWALLSFVRPVQQFGKRRPWILALIVIGGIVGIIVGITIWDNGNIAARNAKWAEERRQDSLKTVEEEKTFFGDQPIPYRITVWNPDAKPMEVWIDTTLKGTIPPYKMLELQLPWETARLGLKEDGKEISATLLRPDTIKVHRAAGMDVYKPEGILHHLLLVDYSHAYKDGQLQSSFEGEPRRLSSQFTQLSRVEAGGPYFHPANEPAPKTSQYRLCRFVVIPEGCDPGPGEMEYAAWILKRIDSQGPDAPAESPEAQLKAFQER